ncbi:hypothetical protein [Paenibacillus herberti]|uniref:Uncharacterized protein n=1 Tax=Paenibacillus herberti TaxID=1619309 RepID=A0A229P1K5_9BACL|nr:hypothetical protein [Paenibacillus herberti]OXM16092.1 hypothetical protein CGZ75_05160 [Paenibacillus herberti]
MKEEQVHISNFKGSGIGLILVLFILLVIVTSVFCFGPRGQNDDDDPIGVLVTRNYNIYNSTSNYVLVVSTVTSTVSPSPPPEIRSSPGEYNQFQMTGIRNRTVRGVINYNVLDSLTGGFVGTLTINIRLRHTGGTGFRALIDEVSSTAPIRWTESEEGIDASLYIYNNVLL